jgi:hypothetical protein
MKQLQRIVVFLAILALAYPIVQCQAKAIPPIPPMPADYQGFKIIQPDASISPEIKAFLGEWKEGMWRDLGLSWRDGRRAKLIVLSVTSTSAEVLYGRSDDPGSAVPGGWQKSTAEIGRDNQGRMSLGLMPPSGYSIKFFIEGNKLKGYQMKTLAFETTR